MLTIPRLDIVYDRWRSIIDRENGPWRSQTRSSASFPTTNLTCTGLRNPSSTNPLERLLRYIQCISVETGRKDKTNYAGIKADNSNKFFWRLKAFIQKIYDQRGQLNLWNACYVMRQSVSLGTGRKDKTNYAGVKADNSNKFFSDDWRRLYRKLTTSAVN